MTRFAIIGFLVGAFIGAMVVGGMSDWRATAGAFIGISLIFGVILAFVATAVYGAGGAQVVENSERKKDALSAYADELRREREATLLTAITCLKFDPRTVAHKSLADAGLRGEPWVDGYIAARSDIPPAVAVVSRPITSAESDALMAAVASIGGSQQVGPMLAVVGGTKLGWDDAAGGQYYEQATIAEGVKTYNEAVTLIKLLK